MTSIIKTKSEWHEPSFIIHELIKEWGEEGLIWLDGDGSKLGRWVTIGIDPIEQVCCRGLPRNNSGSNPFEALRNLRPGHWTGWLSYEAGAWIEPNNPWRSDAMAMMWIASHDPILKFDLQNKQLWIEGLNKKRIKEIVNFLKSLNHQHNKSKEYLLKERLIYKDHLTINLDSWKWLTSENEYINNVNKIKDWISQGDIFQANLTACCTNTLPKDLLAIDLFYRLKEQCPAPFSGILIGSGAASGEAILSSSPERFLRILPGGIVETRPIKGTRPRSKDNKIDIDLAAQLICSIKDRAENTMIVDILRNDLGRVCKPGSIKVPQLIGLETYSHVHHLTSIVKGCLQDNKTWVDALEACWPGGSITGAPKLRACKRLFELEPISRGPYCGSLIHLGWDGTFDSNILIRSLMIKGPQIKGNAGCGIVADSTATTEVKEMYWKLIPILKSLK